MMPRMDQTDRVESSTPSLVKALIIGDGKCGKTDWTVRAAMSGFKLVYFDGDVARATIKNMIKESRLTPKAASNIYLFAVADTMEGGARDSKFYSTLDEFNSNIVFRWNDSQSRIATRKDDASDEIWDIKPGRMGSNVVFVIDSWTSLVESIMLAAAIANGVDLATASTSEMRPVYQSAGLKATEMLQVIRSMRCHVVVIAHPDEYSHTLKPEGKKVKDIKETELVIDWTKMIPKSTSKPHSMQMAKYFTDILWLGTNATGSERIVDARIAEGKMSGGHWNERKNTEDYSFANLVKQIGGTLPTGDELVESWIIFDEANHAPSEVLTTTVNTAIGLAEKVLDGSTQTTVKTGGMASFMKAKPQ